MVLADGATAHLRPIRADDGEVLRSLFDRLSDDTVQFRFFAPLRQLSDAWLDRLTHVDYDDRMALVAELGDELVAVGRYDREDARDEAEVAFTVEDSQQGRGLGTILLEHLAAVARERGIDTFRASILPGNRRMLDVFRDTAFEVRQRFEGGVIQVEFPIGATDAASLAQADREQRAGARSMDRLLAPGSVAVVGAGRRPGTIGHEIFRNLLAGGFTGPVYPVNATAPSVGGVCAYPSIVDIPGDVDLAVIAVPAEAVLEVVHDCARRGVHGLVVITAGFAESGDGGERQREIVELSRRSGMRLIGPNCMGIVNTDPAVRLNATFAPFVPVQGRVAFASQSGALGIELLSRAGALGLGVSSFVSLGNKGDVSSNDLLPYWQDDPETDVILLYLESFGSPRKFARLAREIARTKPIVAVKSGRTPTGVRAASSHTAALSSPDETVAALFRQAGVIRVDTLEQLLDTAQLLTHQPLPAGRRVAIVSNGGGPAILAADACDASDLSVPELGAAVQERLRAVTSPAATVRNPIDLVASATATDYEHALRIVLASDEVDAVLAIFVPPLVTQADDVARAIVDVADGPKPVIACFLGHEGVPDALRSEGGRAIPSFAFPESAVRALGRVAAHADWLRRPPGVVPDLPGIDAGVGRALVDRFLGEHPGGGWLDPDDAARVVGAFGVSCVRTCPAATADEAVAVSEALGYPVALKAGSGAIVHKSDVGAVHLGLRSADEVRSAFDAMSTSLGAEMGGAVLQPMVASGVETIVGILHDRSFGPAVLFGMGGTTAELLRDTAMQLVPVTDADAHDLVRALRTSPLLFGYRGSERADIDALEDLLMRVGRLADALPEVVELDANPVVVSATGVVALDLKVRVEPASPDHDDLRALSPP